MKDFSWTLARLLSMNGSPVHITVGEEDPKASVLAAFGGILSTAQAMGGRVDRDELVVLSFDHVIAGMRVGTVFIHRSRFRGAERDEDGTLRIWAGRLLLCLESLGESSRPPKDRDQQGSPRGSTD
jgi:hypothetical protein